MRRELFYRRDAEFAEKKLGKTVLRTGSAGIMTRTRNKILRYEPRAVISSFQYAVFPLIFLGALGVSAVNTDAR
jgi:hypothetical protein